MQCMQQCALTAGYCINRSHIDYMQHGNLAVHGRVGNVRPTGHRMTAMFIWLATSAGWGGNLSIPPDQSPFFRAADMVMVNASRAAWPLNYSAATASRFVSSGAR